MVITRYEENMLEPKISVELQICREINHHPKHAHIAQNNHWSLV